ncbi:MAG: insulinase family protein [Deltaproteobacteria bacterium]|nr:insulinase family protein [Deltaproteobacteria bacterium]
MRATAGARSRAQGRIEKTELANGIRVLSEEIPGVASVALGLWVEHGSRDETPPQNGLSHFIEHLFFKGTARRSAGQIAEEIDAVGGVLNADTDREFTCYYAKVLGEQSPLAIDLLADIFLDSRFDAEEIVREREVVLEEIAQIEDTPDDLIHDLFHREYWRHHPLGAPVCGTRATVTQFDRAACVELFDARYRADRLVIAAAGQVEHAALVDEIAARFAGLEGHAAVIDGTIPTPSAGVAVYERKLEQVQLCLGTRGVAVSDPARDAVAVLNAALGDSPSSRLFQEIRERRGRAYSIDSFVESYRDTGYIGIAAGTRARWVEEVVDVVLAELRRIRREGFPADELARAKGKLKGTLLLALETSDQRMERLALNELYFGRAVSVEEIARRVDAVCNDDVVAAAERLFVPDGCALVLLGDLRGHTPGPCVFEALG